VTHEAPGHRDTGARTRRVAAGVVVLLGIAYAARMLGTNPVATRNWVPEQARPATAVIDSHTVSISGVRNFTFDSAGTATPGWYDATYDLDSLETAWFVLTTFSKTWRAPAHTFVSFGFAGGKYVAISVEARREVGEEYGITAGLFNSYELIYVIGDERDLIGRRAVVAGDDTWLYPVRAPKEKIRAMFVAMLRRANRLQEDPEFYNSMTNSCTSNLVRHVNDVAPGRIPSGLKVLVPGYTDDVAAGLGLIDGSGNIDSLRARYLINERARAAMTSGSFSILVRRP
jgi:hypothetical protein